MLNQRSNRFAAFQIVIAFAAVYLIWGSTYLAIRYAIETLPPFLMIGVRFLMSGLAFYAWARFRGTPAPRRRDWRSAWMVGTFMVCGGTGLVAWAEQTVPSGLTALLVGSMPLWIVLLDWLQPSGNRPSTLTTLGIVMGIGGVALLVIPSGFAEFRIDLLGAGSILLASFFWAYGSLLSRRLTLSQSATMSLGMNMLAGSISLLLVSLVAGEWQDISVGSVSTLSWLSLAYLAIVGSVAYGAYLWLLRHTTPAKASTYAFVNPAVAMFLGVTVGGEPFDARTLVASAIIIAAVAIIVLQSRRPSRLEHAQAVDRRVEEGHPCPTEGKS